MSSAVKAKTGKDVIDAILQASTPAQKAKATRMQKEYIAQRVAEGKDPKKVLAGLRSRVSRLRGETGQKAAPKKVKGRASKAK